MNWVKRLRPASFTPSQDVCQNGFCRGGGQIEDPAKLEIIVWNDIVPRGLTHIQTKTGRAVLAKEHVIYNLLTLQIILSKVTTPALSTCWFWPLNSQQSRLITPSHGHLVITVDFHVQYYSTRLPLSFNSVTDPSHQNSCACLEHIIWAAVYHHLTELTNSSKLQEEQLIPLSFVSDESYPYISNWFVLSGESVTAWCEPHTTAHINGFFEGVHIRSYFTEKATNYLSFSLFEKNIIYDITWQ